MPEANRPTLPRTLGLAACAAAMALVLGGAALPDPGANAGVPGARRNEARAALPVRAHPVTGFAGRRPLRPYEGALVRSRARVPDFGRHADVGRKKQEFFGWMLPLVELENARLLDVRNRLTWIFDHLRWGAPLSPEDRQWLRDVAAEFRIHDQDPQSPVFWRAVLERVDVLPVDLVLVQAANESAWGTSRFAREGNNLFGQWCFRPGCGMVPQDRPDGASFEVARFASPSESVGSYMRNLNTGASYRSLRRLRARARAEGLQPDAEVLAAGLVDYSERGDLYVEEIRSMIRTNRRAIAAVRRGGDGSPDEEG